MLPPLLFGRHDFSFVRVNVDLVGINAYSQLASAAGFRKKACLQSHWKERDRLIALTQLRKHFRRQLRLRKRRQHEASLERENGHPCTPASAPRKESGSVNGNAYRQ